MALPCGLIVCRCHPCLGESDFLLHTHGIHWFLQKWNPLISAKMFPKRLNKLLKRTMLQLGPKENVEVKANLLTEKGSEIRHFLFLFQPIWKYKLRRQFGILFRWWYGLWSGNQVLFLDLNITSGEMYRCSFLLLKLKFPIPNSPQLCRRKWFWYCAPIVSIVHLCHQTFYEKSMSVTW